MIIPTLLLLGNAHGLNLSNNLDLTYPILDVVECKEVFSAPALRTSSGTTSGGGHYLALRLKRTGWGSTTTSANYVAERYVSVKAPGGALATPANYWTDQWGQGYVYKQLSGDDEWLYVPATSASNEATQDLDFSVIFIIRNSMSEGFVEATGGWCMKVRYKRFNCLEAAIDSRKSYGQPNTAGITPADPNAPLRNINFGDWTFRGGLFIGNMPSSGKDKSGTARIQFYPETSVDVSAGFIAACFATNTVKAPPELGSSPPSLSVRAYVPTSEHAALSSLTVAQKEMAVTWNTRWLIGSFDPGTSNVGGPFDPQTISTQDTSYCWSLSKDDSGWAHGQPNIGVVLSMDESSLTVTNWRYFASREWLAQKDALSQGVTNGRARITTLRTNGSGNWNGFPANIGQ